MPKCSNMSSGRINSPRSMETAQRVVEAFDGRWSDVRRSAQRSSDGVYVIRQSELDRRNQAAHDRQR
jgi:hypothetical protein